MIPEVEKVDKEIKIQYDKMEKSKDKYFKSCKEYEELVLSVQGAEWNKEITVNYYLNESLMLKINFYRKSIMPPTLDKNPKPNTIKLFKIIINL